MSQTRMGTTRRNRSKRCGLVCEAFYQSEKRSLPEEVGFLAVAGKAEVSEALTDFDQGVVGIKPGFGSAGLSRSQVEERLRGHAGFRVRVEQLLIRRKYGRWNSSTRGCSWRVVWWLSSCRRSLIWVEHGVQEETKGVGISHRWMVSAANSLVSINHTSRYLHTP